MATAGDDLSAAVASSIGCGGELPRRVGMGDPCKGDALGNRACTGGATLAIGAEWVSGTAIRSEPVNANGDGIAAWEGGATDAMG